MSSFKTTAFAAIALFVGTQAQSQYTIDPNSVLLATRQKWCDAQQASCPLLCLQLPGQSSTTAANTCDPTSLEYDCVCGNGLSPNSSEYSQTLPYFICTEWGQQCVANCGSGNTACQAACIQDHPCGAQDPIRVNATSSSSTMTATATGTNGAAASGAAPTVYNGFGAGATAGSATSSTASPKSGAQAALDLGRCYGLAVVVAGLFAGFALVI